MSLRWMSINIRGLNHPAKRSSLWKTALDSQCDILCVQETHFLQSKPPRCSHRKYPHVYCANSPAKNKGVLIAIKDTVVFNLIHEIHDDSGRYILLVAEINGITYTILNLYAPNQKQTKFIRKMIALVTQHQKGSLIVCGDFNSVMNANVDCSSVGRRRRPNIGSLCFAEGLYDPWRCLHTTERDYSYYSRVHNSYSRIDMFLTDKFHLQRVIKAELRSITWSVEMSRT